MLQRTLPAGFIAPCAPTKIDRLPNIQHTVRYTELSPHRFKDFWR
jgi:hypothetical protein